MSDSVQPHRGQPTRLPRPWDFPGKKTGVGCHFLLQCMKVKSESEVAQLCLTLATPWTADYQPPPSMGFSPAHSASVCRVQAHPSSAPRSSHAPPAQNPAGFARQAVSTSSRPTSPRCHPVPNSVRSVASLLPLGGPQHRPRPHTPTFPLLSSWSRPLPSPPRIGSLESSLHVQEPLSSF